MSYFLSLLLVRGNIASPGSFYTRLRSSRSLIPFPHPVKWGKLRPASVSLRRKRRNSRQLTVSRVYESCRGDGQSEKEKQSEGELFRNVNSTFSSREFIPLSGFIPVNQPRHQHPFPQQSLLVSSRYTPTFYTNSHLSLFPYIRVLSETKTTPVRRPFLLQTNSRILTYIYVSFYETKIINQTCPRINPNTRNK